VSSTPKIVAVVGKSGCGKTWVAARMAALLSRPLVVIVHTHRDPSYLQHIDATRTRFVGVYRGAPPLGSQFFLDALADGLRYVYISIYSLGPDAARAWLDSLVPDLEAIGNLALIVDEAHRFCRHEYVPERLVELPRWARSIGIDVVFVTHRLVDLSPDLRTVLTYLVLFHSDEPRDLAECALRLSVGQEAVEAVRSLSPWQHIVVDLEHGRRSPVRVI
jgi:hypothetical protein